LAEDGGFFPGEQFDRSARNKGGRQGTTKHKLTGLRRPAFYLMLPILRE
jgi:hypothetical protein